MVMPFNPNMAFSMEDQEKLRQQAAALRQKQATGTLTADDQMQLQAIMDKTSDAAKMIAGAESPNWGTALAKTVAAGYQGKQDQKRKTETQSKLRKALQKLRGEEKIDRDELIGLKKRRIAVEEADAGETNYLNPEFVVPPNGGTPIKVVREKGTHDWINSATGETVDLTGYTKAVARSEQRVGDIEQLKPTGKQTQDYLASTQALDVMSDMDRARNGLSDADKELYNNPIRDVGTSIAPAAVKGMVSDAAYGDSPEVQTLRAEERKAMAAFRLLVSGKQVTGPEFLREADWSPTAAGLKTEERQRRWDVLNKETQNIVKRHENTFSEYIVDPYTPKTNDDEMAELNRQIAELKKQLNE